MKNEIKETAAIEVPKKYLDQICLILDNAGYKDLAKSEKVEFALKCKASGLNPLKRECYPIPFGKKDGTRSIACVCAYDFLISKAKQNALEL